MQLLEFSKMAENLVMKQPSPAIIYKDSTNIWTDTHTSSHSTEIARKFSICKHFTPIFKCNSASSIGYPCAFLQSFDKSICN